VRSSDPPRAPCRPLFSARASSVAGLALACALCGCHGAAPESADEAAAREAPLVRTTPILRGTAVERIEIAGTLQPLPGQDVKLGALSAGRLLELHAGEGDHVRQGQLLGRIDPAPLRALADQARAQVDQARAQEENASLREQRSARAVDAGVAARQELEDAQLGLATARAAALSAKGALAAAQNQLERSELRAPFDGLVAHVFAAQGELVEAGRPVLEIVRVQSLELRGAASAENASRLRAGQAAEISSAGANAVAQVLAVAPVIDAATGAATVRLRVENPDGALKAGAAARAFVAVARRENALLVPRAALLPAAADTGADGTICVVPQSSLAHCAPVHTRPAQEGQLEIVDDSLRKQGGLEAGALAIIEGSYALPEGARVRTQAAGAKGEQPGAPSAAGETNARGEAAPR